MPPGRVTYNAANVSNKDMNAMENNIPHSNAAGANVLSTIRMLYTSAAMASLERLPEAPVN